MSNRGSKVKAARAVAAIYARVSSERQKEERTIASQTATLKQEAKTLGYTVPKEWVFEDEGYSGMVLMCPGLDRVRDLAAEGQIAVLLVYSPDRLSRKYAYQVLLIEELARHGVEVRFIHGPQAETPEEHLLIQFQGTIAKYERAQIVERTRRGKRHRARGGSVNVLSGAPYGYRYVRKSETSEAYYEVLAAEAAVVQRVFNLYTEDGLSINAIARWLNDQAVSTRHGASRWCRSTVWAMLRNPAYSGKACFGKTEKAERQRMTRPLRQRGDYAPRSSANRERPREDWIEIAVPALVSEEQFALAQEQLEHNKRHSPRRTREPTLLQSMLVCKRCGYAYYRTSTRTSKRKLYYYRCLGSDDYRYVNGRICERRPVRQDALDEVVWGSIMELLAEPTLIRAEITRRLAAARDNRPSKRREEALRKEHIRLEKQTARLLDAYQEELLTLDELRRRTGDLSKRTRAVELEVKALEDSAEDEQRYMRIAETVEAFLERLQANADVLDIESRQRVLRLLVKEILVDHDTITIKHSIPVIGSGSPPPGTSGDVESSSYLLRSGRHLTAVQQCLSESTRSGLAPAGVSRDIGSHAALVRR